MVLPRIRLRTVNLPRHWARRCTDQPCCRRRISPCAWCWANLPKCCSIRSAPFHRRRWPADLSFVTASLHRLWRLLFRRRHRRPVPRPVEQPVNLRQFRPHNQFNWYRWTWGIGLPSASAKWEGAKFECSSGCNHDRHPNPLSNCRLIRHARHHARHVGHVQSSGGDA